MKTILDSVHISRPDSARRPAVCEVWSCPAGHWNWGRKRTSEIRHVCPGCAPGLVPACPAPAWITWGHGAPSGPCPEALGVLCPLSSLLGPCTGLSHPRQHLRDPVIFPPHLKCPAVFLGAKPQKALSKASVWPKGVTMLLALRQVLQWVPENRKAGCSSGKGTGAW